MSRRYYGGRRPPPAVALSHKLFVCGGRDESGQTLDSAIRFTAEIGNPRTNLVSGQVLDGTYAVWEQIPSLHAPRWGAASALSGGQLYVFGGYDGEHILRSAEKFDTEPSAWAEVPPLPSRRAQAAAAAADGKIYISGGYNGLSELDTVDCFDTAKHTWTQLPPMRQKRLDHAMAAIVLPTGPRLLVLGGAGDAASIATVERLTVDAPIAEGEAPAWEEIAPTSCARRGLAVAVWNKLLWVCGGHTGARCLNTVEALDTRTWSWVEKPPMQEARFGAVAAVLGDKLYVCGGHSGDHILRSVERFVHETNSWESVSVDMPSCRSMFCAAVLPNPLDSDEKAKASNSRTRPLGDRSSSASKEAPRPKSWDAPASERRPSSKDKARERSQSKDRQP